MLYVQRGDYVLMSPGYGDQQQLWSSKIPCALHERTSGRLLRDQILGEGLATNDGNEFYWPRQDLLLLEVKYWQGQPILS